MHAKRVDLHAHTDHSDGTLEPPALVALAREVGLDALAVTDHDTTSALAEAHEVGRARGVEILDGCEISSQTGGATVHVLAYAFDPEDRGFQGFLSEVRAGRERRNLGLYARLAELGMPVSPEDVARHVRGRIVARPHFAHAMVDRGYVPDVRTAFQRWLHDRGPAYVFPDTPSPEDAVRAATEAGGVTVLAHPKQVRLPNDGGLEGLVRRMKDAGLAGLEVDHPSHDVSDRRAFRALADALGLVASGGSDFHGANKPHLSLGTGDGSIDVPYETWERLLARRR
jgi:predicted metal-dependent phosphoesterase TrpH